MMNNLISAGSIPRSLGRRLAESQRIEERRVRKVDMDELLSISDIVSIHIPLNESTRHLINKELKRWPRAVGQIFGFLK
jgi:hypothetical protein